MQVISRPHFTLTRARSRERARRAAGVERCGVKRSDWALVKVRPH